MAYTINQNLMWFFDIKLNTPRFYPTDKLELGALGEQEALNYFLDMGYVLMDRNWRHSRYEIDLILKDDTCVVFCEVRTQDLDNINYTTPAESMTSNEKLEKVSRAANFYLANCCYTVFKVNLPCRFDMAEVFIKDGKAVKINHLKDIYVKTRKVKDY